MDHAKMIALLEYVLRDYHEHSKNLSAVDVPEGTPPEVKEQWESLQATTDERAERPKQWDAKEDTHADI